MASLSLRYFVGALILVVGCGADSPVGPTPTEIPPPPIPPQAPPPTPPPPQVARVAGTWAGTMHFTFAPQSGSPLQPGTYQVDIRVELQQQDRAVIGSWRITTPGNDGRGEIRGALEGFDAETRFSGEVTWRSETSTGTGACQGVATFSGPAFFALEWRSPQGWEYNRTCQNAVREVVWRLGPRPVEGGPVN